MKVIVAHPGRQHSYRLASALHKRQNLLYYITTIYNKDSSILMKLSRLILSGDNRKRASNRKNDDLPDDIVIQIGEARGYFEAFISRIDLSHEIYRFFQRINARHFGIKVAKLAIKEKADAVIMYDSNALDGFKYLAKKAPQIKRILDVSIAARPYMKLIYDEEIKKSGNIDLYVDNRYMWNKNKLRRSISEIQLSQYFLSASSFVDESLVYCGAESKRILRASYGSNVSTTIIDKSVNDTLQLLFVGQVIYRKGITYLLEAVSKYSNKVVNLRVVGSYNRASWFVKKYSTSSNIVFEGLVTPDKVKEYYAASDVFVIPSFAEGMAQVGIEAMSCGLPIICTHNSGIADAIIDGVNGFIIKPGSVEAITEKINWFISHKEKIKEMGEAAHETSLQYTWDNYELQIDDALHTILDT